MGQNLCKGWGNFVRHFCSRFSVRAASQARHYTGVVFWNCTLPGKLLVHDDFSRLDCTWRKTSQVDFTFFDRLVSSNGFAYILCFSQCDFVPDNSPVRLNCNFSCVV